jgi:hypothetical protein
LPQEVKQHDTAAEDKSLNKEPETAAEIVDRFEAQKTDGEDADTREHLREQFLQAIRDDPSLLEEPRLSQFLADEIEAEALAEMEWDSPQQMASFSESLYHSRFDSEAFASKFREHARLLLRQALQQYEKAGEKEKMFRLLRLAPSYLLRQDEELSRLHYRANVYEIRRVRRGRRMLHGFLLIQAILVLFVFPFLFINAENGQLQREVEQLADVEIGDEGYQLITYSEGVYWAVITAASIGYGDITPTTTTGRIIASVLGLIGVVTIGILAGLVLDWISPRQIV